MAAGVLGSGIVNVVNKLQDVFVTIGTSTSQIDLPHICVLGSQGNGKSVLLEVSLVFLRTTRLITAPDGTRSSCRVPLVKLSCLVAPGL